MARDPRDRRDRDDDEDFDDDRPRRPPRRRPRDDDDDRPRPGRGRPRADNTVKVLLIVGGVVVALALVCGGVAVYVYSSIARQIGVAQNQLVAEEAKIAAEHQRARDAEIAKIGEDHRKERAAAVNSDKTKATEAVGTFMQDLKASRTAAAYRVMSAEYRRTTTEAAFGAFVTANATHLNSHFPPKADPFTVETGTTYTFNVNTTGLKRCTVVAILEGGKWVMDSLTVADR